MANNGDILLVKNIVFNDGIADHASLTGRICLIISDCNDKLSLLPFTHIKPKNLRRVFMLNDKDLLNKKKSVNYYKNEYIKLDGLFQREIYFYDKIARINEIKYYLLLEKLFKLDLSNNKYCSGVYCDIEHDLLRQKNELKLKI